VYWNAWMSYPLATCQMSDDEAFLVVDRF